MGRVRQVGFSVFLVLEGHQEAVGKPIVETFGAVVGPVLKGGYFGNLGLQSSESIDDLLDFNGGTGFLELENHNVAEHGFFVCLRFRFGLVTCVDDHQGHKRREQQSAEYF